jgi:hypothetical protein
MKISVLLIRSLVSCYTPSIFEEDIFADLFVGASTESYMCGSVVRAMVKTGMSSSEGSSRLTAMKLQL